MALVDILVFLIFTHLVLITTQKCAEIIILAYTGAEQESSILKSYKHMLNVPITPPPWAPFWGVAAKPIWIEEIIIYHQYKDIIL